LKYGLVDRNGLVVLTGDIGTGKTTVVNALLDALDDDVCVAKINHPSLEPDQFLSLMAKTFDPDFVVASKSDLLLFFKNFLKKEHARGRTVLLVVDEAHRLSAEVMEEIRLLTNIEQAGKSLLSVIFVGQQELLPILQSPQCRALRQRITLYYNIDALTGEETALYMQHRLTVSSAKAPLFSPEAITRIYTYTKGFPRMINILCDRALVTGYVKGAHLIDEAIITECAREIDLLPEKSTPLFWTKVNWMRSHGGSLLRRAAKAVAGLKQRAKAAAGSFGGALSRWHSKGGQFTKQVLRRSGRLKVRLRRGMVMNLAVLAAPLLLSAWTIQAFSVAEAPEPTIALKRPKTAVAEPAHPFGNQAQKATALKRAMPPLDTTKFASSPSKPAVQPEATTFKEKPLTDKNATPAPIFLPPVRPTPQELADTAPAEDNLKRGFEPVELNRHDGSQVRENSARPYARALMRSAGEIVAPSPSEDRAFLPNAKPSTFSHKVKWPQETLYAIALWYAGSGEHWKEIAAANPSMAPDQIQIGNTIAIPLSLIKTHEPMSYGFLENRMKSRQTPAVTTHRTPVEPPPLFSSIDHPSR
jgi:type II secretory pathway predicted ATPase ExeA